MDSREHLFKLLENPIMINEVEYSWSCNSEITFPLVLCDVDPHITAPQIEAALRPYGVVSTLEMLIDEFGSWSGSWSFLLEMKPNKKRPTEIKFHSEPFSNTIILASQAKYCETCKMIDPSLCACSTKVDNIISRENSTVEILTTEKSLTDEIISTSPIKPTLMEEELSNLSIESLNTEEIISECLPAQKTTYSLRQRTSIDNNAQEVFDFSKITYTNPKTSNNAKSAKEKSTKRKTTPYSRPRPYITKKQVNPMNSDNILVTKSHENSEESDKITAERNQSDKISGA